MTATDLKGASTIRTKAEILSGLKTLIRNYVELGLPISYRTDDALRMLLTGKECLFGAPELLNAYEQVGRGGNLDKNSHMTVPLLVSDRTLLLENRLQSILDEIDSTGKAQGLPMLEEVIYRLRALPIYLLESAPVTTESTPQTPTLNPVEDDTLHDLAVTHIRAPKRARVGSRIKAEVTIKNHGKNIEKIVDNRGLAKLIQFQVTPKKSCQKLFTTSKLPRKLYPLTLKPGKSVVLPFQVSVGGKCAGSGDASLSYRATLSLSALNGLKDAVLENDRCPRRSSKTLANYGSSSATVNVRSCRIN